MAPLGMGGATKQHEVVFCFGLEGDDACLDVGVGEGAWHWDVVWKGFARGVPGKGAKPHMRALPPWGIAKVVLQNRLVVGFGGEQHGVVGEVWVVWCG